MTRINKAVVGAGAAGLMAALAAAQAGKTVTVLEKNRAPGRKLNITGKGRCNVTNNCDITTFLENIVTNPKFLYAALHALPPQAMISLLEQGGLATKTERGRRVFPQSDRASDVTDFLVTACRRAGVEFVRAAVQGLVVENGAVTGLRVNGETVGCDSVIVATGGLSYPQTGSTGDGYAWARAAGHTIVPPQPSLVPLNAAGGFCRACMGLSLKNVGLSFRTGDGRELYGETGEMLFTHFGVSGPVVLSASAYLRGRYPCNLYIDLKPALTADALDRRLLRDFSENANRDFINALGALLPQKLIAPFVALTGIEPRKKVNEITREERRTLLSLLKALPLTVTSPRPVAEAIVTAGGVDVREVDPKTMRSKKVKNLLFAGEILDVDAYTGGYNLQIAFSTGFLAGQNC